MDLVEFLLARIAEDEAVARAAGGRYTWSAIAGFVIDEIHDDDLLASAEHIARWDPARVLAECEAKRRIVELHQLVGVDLTGDCCMTCLNYEDGNQYIPGPCDTLRLLALPYADQADYRAEWKP